MNHMSRLSFLSVAAPSDGKRDAFYFDTEAAIIPPTTNNQRIHPHLTQHTSH